MGGAAAGAQGAATPVHGAARAQLPPSDTASSSGWSPPRQRSGASVGAQGGAARVHGAARAQVLPSGTQSRSSWSPERQRSEWSPDR